MKYIPVTDLSTIKADHKQPMKPSAKKRLKKWLTLLVCLAACYFLFSGLAIHAKARLAQALLERSWQQQGDNHLPKPWPWADTRAVAKLAFPTLAKEHIVLANDSGQALAFGPGLSGLSSVPGDSGNIIIAGHRDTHFSILQYLNLEETIILLTPKGEEIEYRIDDIKVIDTRTESLFKTETDKLVLITCYPFNSDQGDPHLRYVLEAKPV